MYRRQGLVCTTPMVEVLRAVGRARAMEMLLTGDPVDATTAAAWGLINRAVEPERLDDEVRALVARIAAAGRTVGMKGVAGRGPGPEVTVRLTSSDADASSGRQARTRSRIISTMASPTGIRRNKTCAASNSLVVKTAVAFSSVAPVVAMRMSRSVLRSG